MNKKTILVFGGNGFIGVEVVEYLLNNAPDYEIVLVNRGNWDSWDSAERIKHRIKENIVCDRYKDSLKICLHKYLNEETFQFEAVIDFSAFKSRVIKNVINEIPAEKIKRYILISTDSVYEVCVDKKLNQNEALILKETDSIRPNSIEEQNRLKKLDSYGHHKFKCEEELVNNAKFPYVFLRLPDVIGPRDSTNRFWLYQMWLQFLQYTYPEITQIIRVPKSFYNKKTSYIYVNDIARIIHIVLHSDVKNDVFNIGFETPLSIIDIHRIIAILIKPGFEKNLVFIPYSDDSELQSNILNDHKVNLAFPSVTKGPIDVSKFNKRFGFRPYDLIKAFSESVEFLNQAYAKFPKERLEIEKELKKEYFKKRDDDDKFSLFINNIVHN